MQSNCIFPGRYAPLTYYDCPRNTLMARNVLRSILSLLLKLAKLLQIVFFFHIRYSLRRHKTTCNCCFALQCKHAV